DVQAGLAQGKSIQTTRELPGGRIVHIANRPMPGGGWIAMHEDVTERIRNEERIAYLARHDILTGLPNRLHFRERAEEAMPLLRRAARLAVLCIDLDHFKEVNDALGHPAGDKLLQLVACGKTSAKRIFLRASAEMSSRSFKPCCNGRKKLQSWQVASSKSWPSPTKWTGKRSSSAPASGSRSLRATATIPIS